MKDIVNFFLLASKLKRMKRTGWVWLGVKNPETIAGHSFRTAYFAWILGKKAGINISRAMQIALIHDLCEVYAGDLTPYWGILPRDRRARKRVLGRWIRLRQQEKKALAHKKFAVEQKALLRLVKSLRKDTQERIISLWLDFERGLSKEGRFVKQIDKIEALLQSIEYFGIGRETPVVGWWEEVEELVVHPLLIEFVHAIHVHFYTGEKTKLDRELSFFHAIEKLKHIPRMGWVVRGVKNSETMADHAFMLALMTLILTRECRLPFDIGEAIKLSLAQVLPSVSTREKTPYDFLLRRARTAREKRTILQKWIRNSMEARERIFEKNFREEKKALFKTVHPLPFPVATELASRWEDWKSNRTREARFVNQVYALDALLQALQYWKENKRFPIDPWWEWAFEHSHSDLTLSFMEELKKRFY